METRQKTSLILPFAGLAIMVTLYLLTTFGMVGHNAVGNTATYNNPLIIPEGYAFSIWGLIYLGLIIFPFYQLIKRSERIEPEWVTIRILYTINVILNGLWLVFASFDWLVLTVLTIIPMLYTLFRINQLVLSLKSQGYGMSYLLEHFVFSVYFAWITLATVLNIAAALSYYEWNGFGLSELTWSYIMLPITAIIAGIAARKYRDNAYAGVVIWAFAALVVRHYYSEPALAILSASVIAAFLLLMLINVREKAVSKLIVEM